MTDSQRRGFAAGIPDLERDPNWYDGLYGSPAGRMKYAAPWNRSPLRTLTWYPALVLAEAPILEVGSGSGQFAAMCRDFGLSYVRGLDSSGIAVQMARKLVPGTEFYHMSAMSEEGRNLLALDDYRTCVVIEVLEHIYDDLGLLRQIPEGRSCVLTVPSFHTEGHVRWFATRNQVVARYQQILDVVTVIEETSHESDNLWWILKGFIR